MRKKIKFPCGKYLFTRPLEDELGGGSENCGGEMNILCKECEKLKNTSDNG